MPNSKGTRIDVFNQRLAYYNTQRLRSNYEFDGAPLFIMTSD